MFLKKIFPLQFILLAFLLSHTTHSFSFNRWFKVRPGIKISASIVDFSTRIPKNNNDLSFGFLFGGNLDFQLEKFIGLDFEILYSRKGALLQKPGNDIVLHYISVPTLLKFWFVRKKFAFSFGPVHHFLLSGNGKLIKPNVQLTTNSFSPYDLSLSFGLQYIFVEFKNGYRLVSDFRFEIGLVNIHRQFRPEIFNRTYPQLGIGINF